MNISIKDESGLPITFAVAPKTFPGGEVMLKLNQDYRDRTLPMTITAHIHNSNDVMEVMMAQDAIKRMYPKVKEINLFMPYVPYARQDRVCDKGEAFSLKVFADLINHLNFNQVTVVDPHSDVTGAVFNNLKIISQLDVVAKFKEFKDRIWNNGVFVAPDAGANKKTSALAHYFNHKYFIRADKRRDMATGKILETIVYTDDLEGSDAVIVDDLCDGGRTFIELAKVLKNKNAGKIILYATHGIFSAGFRPLFDGGIDEIYTTDSFQAGFLGYLPSPPKLNILKVENLIK
jgi:ribose-phosphate pyrophosphokinase